MPFNKNIRASLMVVAFFCSAVQAYQTQHVFILVIDGARYSETFGDSTHQYIPRIWNKLRPLGTICTAHYTDSVTVTNPGHATIVTGTWQRITNNGKERPHQPTVFEYFRKENGAAAEQNYVILGKDKLSILAYSDNAGYGEAYGASVKTSSAPYDDAATFNNIEQVAAAAHPRLAVINFAQVDAAGHSGKWDAYCAAIRQADSLIAELWDLIQHDPVYQGKTTLIVDNDHGRHTADFTSHGDSCEGCRHILLLVLGPDTPAGQVDTVRHEQVDIAPTVGALLGFATPRSIGNVIQSVVSSAKVPPKAGKVKK